MSSTALTGQGGGTAAAFGPLAFAGNGREPSFHQFAHVARRQVADARALVDDVPPILFADANAESLFDREVDVEEVDSHFSKEEKGSFTFFGHS